MSLCQIKSISLLFILNKVSKALATINVINNKGRPGRWYSNYFSTAMSRLSVTLEARHCRTFFSLSYWQPGTLCLWCRLGTECCQTFECLFGYWLDIVLLWCQSVPTGWPESFKRNKSFFNKCWQMGESAKRTCFLSARATSSPSLINSPMALVLVTALFFLNSDTICCFVTPIALRSWLNTVSAVRWRFLYRPKTFDFDIVSILDWLCRHYIICLALGCSERTSDIHATYHSWLPSALFSF